MYDNDRRAEGLNDLQDEQAHPPPSSTLPGKVYETPRSGPHHIPQDDHSSLPTDLNRGAVQSARRLVSKYLDPAESDVRHLE